MDTEQIPSRDGKRSKLADGQLHESIDLLQVLLRREVNLDPVRLPGSIGVNSRAHAEPPIETARCGRRCPLASLTGAARGRQRAWPRGELESRDEVTCQAR